MASSPAPRSAWPPRAQRPTDPDRQPPAIAASGGTDPDPKSVQIYLCCPRLHDLNRPKRGEPPRPSTMAGDGISSAASPAGGWMRSPPQIRVLIHQSEHTTRLAALMPLGQQVGALSRTPSQ